MGTTASTADTTPRRLSAFRRRTVYQGFLALNLALFVYSVADWFGWLTFERGFQPLARVCLSGAMVLLPAASLIQRRSMLVFVVLVAASIALLVMSVTVGR